jgi:hypothetical protein
VCLPSSGAYVGAHFDALSSVLRQSILTIVDTRRVSLLVVCASFTHRTYWVSAPTMAQDQTMVLRSKILTNSAAEFVETGAGQAIIAQVVDSDQNSKVKPLEFVSEIDKFVPQDEVQEYVHLSPFTSFGSNKL